MAGLTIRWLRRVNPDQRLVLAVWLFWGSVAGGVFCTIFLCSTWFQRVLMAISWAAITIGAWDVITTADVRAEIESSDG